MVTEGGSFDTRGTKEELKALKFAIILASYHCPFILIALASQVTNKINE
jgi:hypothetical protein